MTNSDRILAIINDFDKKVIPDFFDLEKYETDYEISRHFIKSLRIGYIKKEEIEKPQKAIYINFNKKYFSISAFPNSIMIEKIIFQDYYQNYDSISDVYKKVLLICKNKDSVLDDASLLFDKLDEHIARYNKLSNSINEKWTLYNEIYTQIINLEIEGKIASEHTKKPISYLQDILNNDGPEYSYVIKFWQIWDYSRKYEIGVCVRGEPILRKLN